jgi:hypothetical protein
MTKAERARQRELKLSLKREKRRVGKRAFNDYLRSEEYDEIVTREKIEKPRNPHGD